jgi:hypothetical protein
VLFRLDPLFGRTCERWSSDSASKEWADLWADLRLLQGFGLLGSISATTLLQAFVSTLLHVGRLDLAQPHLMAAFASHDPAGVSGHNVSRLTGGLLAAAGAVAHSRDKSNAATRVGAVLTPDMAESLIVEAASELLAAAPSMSDPSVYSAVELLSLAPPSCRVSCRRRFRSRYACQCDHGFSRHDLRAFAPCCPVYCVVSCDKKVTTRPFASCFTRLLSRSVYSFLCCGA